MANTYVMLYLKANADIPVNVETSTARKGSKWFDLLKVGDLLDFHYTEDDEMFGRARVIKTELLSLDDIVKRSTENYAGAELLKQLTAAYGPLQPGNEFSMVHFTRTE